MEQYKKDFIEFMVESDVLTFGDFTTKSGRKTPFFINTGKYRTGEQIKKLGEFYAAAIEEKFSGKYDLLFGPAYKGIPLAVTIAVALSAKYDVNTSFCFNRKEIKDHGEGGSLVGHKPSSDERVLIVEDVTTAGTSIRETVPVLKAAADVKLAGLIVSVDRMEKGQGERGALAELKDEFNFQTESIVNLEEIVSYLHNKEINGKVILDDTIKSAIDAYREKYGAK